MNKYSESFLSQMAAGAWVVTPNKHMAHDLNIHYIKCANKKIVTKPCCYPYQAFVQTCWQSIQQSHLAKNHPKLLTQIQTSFLWELSTPKILNSNTLSLNSQEIFSAWRMAQWWQLKIDTIKEYQHTLSDIYIAWSENFEKLLLQHNAITDAQLISYFVDFQLQLPTSNIIFACFDDFNPQQLSLHEQLKLNHNVEILDFKPTKNNTKVYSATDNLDERTKIAQWIKWGGQENLTQALIVTDLNKQGNSIQRWLSMNFPSLSFHCSLGKALLEYPMVDHAWKIINFNIHKCTIKEAKLLLQSQWIGCSHEERNARAKFLATYIDFKTQQFNLPRWLELLEQQCPELYSTIMHLQELPEEASTNLWPELLIKKLIAFGFPGSMTLNSENYQLYQRFIDQIRTLKTLSAVKSILSKEQILGFLKNILQQSVFQAQPVQNCRLHVLGLLEAAGSYYDSIWIMNLTDAQLPAALNPNKWLPLDLQAQNNMPHTDAIKEHMLADLKLKRFAALSQTCILSYPKFNNDNENRPSIFLQSLPIYEQDLNTNLFDSTNNLIDSGWEFYTDPKNIAFTAQEPISKNSYLLAEQAKCPFRAFASIRLKLKPIEPVTMGLPPHIKGIILHRTLELFWKKFSSQRDLLNLDSLTLSEHIQNCIKTSLTQAKIELRQHNALVILEQERIQRLIQSSLTWELSRSDFKIKGLEVHYTFTLGPLQFNLRVDRVDEISEEQQLIIDYKTTMPSPLPWNEEATLEPQLLLYALLNPSIKAIMFNELKKGHALIKGIGSHANMAPGINSCNEKQTWDELRNNWYIYLLKLATDFHEGVCEAKPTHGKLCQNCNYSSLCRQSLNNRAYYEQN